MTNEELEKLVDSDPRILISEMAKKGIDFSGLDKNIARKMVCKRVPLSNDQFEAVDFVFWVSYLVEHEAREWIVDIESELGARKESIEKLVDRLHFGDKIKFLEETYTDSKDKMIKIMRVIQDLRNDVAHGRFDNLKYGEYYLHDNRGKLLLIGDMRDVFRLKRPE